MRIYLLLFVSMIVVQSSRAQSVTFNFADETQASYSLSVIKSFSFSENTTQLNFHEGFSTIWELDYVISYSFENIPDINASVEMRSISSSPRVYPNPSVDAVTIEYLVTESSGVEVHIVDLNGKLIQVLVSSTQSKGVHSVIWNGKNESGRRVSRGVYAVQVKSESMMHSIKVILQ